MLSFEANALPSEVTVSKTLERRDWAMAEWRNARLRLDEDLQVPERSVSIVEELGLVAALTALGAAIVLLI